MKSEHYQLVKIPDWPNIHYHDSKNDVSAVNLMELKNLPKEKYNKLPEEFRTYIERIPKNFSKPIVLRNIIKRDDYIYYSSFWTAKDSILKIHDYENHGSNSDLNEFLGPFASIPTYRYGVATLHFKHRGETIPFQAAVHKKIWSFGKVYWADVKIYMPSGAEGADLDIAIFDVSSPANDLDLGLKSVYALIPN